MPPSMSWRQLHDPLRVMRFRDSKHDGCSADVKNRSQKGRIALKVYCYRVAGTVGIMTLPVCLGSLGHLLC